MERKGVAFDQVYDVRAVRVIVDTMRAVLQALGIVHTMWRPIPGEFDDYIATPKDNLYQSLHTAVVGDDGRTLEVQIRTREMHESAEYGIAAHWRYKEGGQRDPSYEAEDRLAALADGLAARCGRRPRVRRLAARPTCSRTASTSSRPRAS